MQLINQLVSRIYKELHINKKEKDLTEKLEKVFFLEKDLRFQNEDIHVYNVYSKKATVRKFVAPLFLLAPIYKQPDGHKNYDK